MKDHGIEARERAGHMLSRNGYGKGGECHAEGGSVAKEAKKVVRKALTEHENHEHGGKHTKLRFKAGGGIPGKKSEHRPDRRARGGANEDADEKLTRHMPEGSDGHDIGEDEGRARGGRHEGKKHHEGGGKGKIGAVNIAIGNPDREMAAKKEGVQAGLQLGAKMGGAGGAGGPPPGGPPPGAMPPHPMLPPGAGMAPPPGVSGPPGIPQGGPPPGMPPRARGGMIKVKEHERRRSGGGV